jgi:ankyrin repeat protein
LLQQRSTLPFSSQTCRSSKLSTALLSRGADVNVKDPWGMTPMHLAASMHHPAMVHPLLAHGAAINAASATGFMPLHHTVLGNSPEMAEVPLPNGADVNVVAKRQCTMACSRRCRASANMSC